MNDYMQRRVRDYVIACIHASHGERGNCAFEGCETEPCPTLRLIRARLREADAAREFLEREGYRRCDIPACACGSWHRHRERSPFSAEALVRAAKERIRAGHNDTCDTRRFENSADKHRCTCGHDDIANALDYAPDRSSIDGRIYPCGCEATGPGTLPTDCPTHGHRCGDDGDCAVCAARRVSPSRPN